MEVKKVREMDFIALYIKNYKMQGSCGTESIAYKSVYDFGTPEHERDREKALQDYIESKDSSNYTYKLYRISWTTKVIIDGEEYHRHDMKFFRE